MGCKQSENISFILETLMHIELITFTVLGCHIYSYCLNYIILPTTTTKTADHDIKLFTSKSNLTSLFSSLHYQLIQTINKYFCNIAQFVCEKKINKFKRSIET